MFCTDDFYRFTIAFPCFFRYFNYFSATEVLTCNTFFTVFDVTQSPLCNNLTTMHTCTRTYIYNMVSTADCVFIMFNNNQSVSQIPQVFQCSYQFFIITLMQANAWFIKNIQNTCKH